MEQMDRLWPGGPVFYYDDALFKPGTDAFLLGAFARPRAGDRVCDLGAGTGLIGLLLLAREPSLALHNVELQAAPLRLAEQTAAANGLAASQHLADLRQLEGILPAGGMDYVVSNPPYFPPGSGGTPPDAARRAARAEDSCSLAEVCAAAARLLRWGGRFALVHRPERLAEVFTAMKAAGVEPKRLQLVQHGPDTPPSAVLVEGVRQGRPGLTVLPVLLMNRRN